MRAGEGARPTRVLAVSSGELAGAPAREALREAAAHLGRGDVVAVPTETVYGLAADASDALAVARVFEVKERPRFDPLIVHLPSRDWIGRVAGVAGAEAEMVVRLARAFWPGPLTMVLGRGAAVPDIVTAGLPTVAVRVSAHPVMAALLREFGRPLAAPSANRFGRISPTSAADVVAELGGRIPLVLDAGSTEHGIESTIVRPGAGRIEILRHGPVTGEMLGAFGRVIEAGETVGAPESPGRLPAHYAPRSRLVIAGGGAGWEGVARRGLLAWDGAWDDGGFEVIEWLSRARDPREGASRLFGMLRGLDALALDLIVVEPVPEEGVGRAIMDRLRRAAAGSPGRGGG